MKLTIAQRLIVMVIVTITALALSGAIAYFNTQQLTGNLKYTQDKIITSLDILARAERNFLLIRVNGLYHLSYDDIAKKMPHEDAIKQNTQEIQQLFAQYEKLSQDSKDRELLQTDKQLFASYLQTLDRVLEKSRAKDQEGVRASVENEWKPAGNKLTSAFAAHTEYNQKLAEQIVQRSVESGERSSLALMLATVVAVLLAGGAGLHLERGIATALQHLRSTMQHVAGHLDFTARAEVLRNDEIGQTATAFNQLLDRMQDNIRSVASSAEQVVVAASQVAQTSAQIAAASLQQSEAASSMSASIEQMSVSITHVGDRAGDVHRFSSESGQLAGEGEQVIGNTVKEINHAAGTVNQAADHIRQLETQSLQISSVVAVIKDVADQTNLLALNAAIEAARAGEQGRGFAVVADEVRKLAERTAASTHEITHTIESMRNGARNAVEGMQQIVKQVTSSVERVTTANHVMAQIGHGSRNGVAMVDEIVSAIREQGSASNSIAQQIEQIAQMAEEGSCAAHEGAQSARELDQLAVGMQQMVAAYRL